MIVVRGRKNLLAALGRPLVRSAVAIGSFDGVHRGHQTLLATARRLADTTGGDVVALTFDPHPARLLAPALAPPLILSLERRVELLGAAGADVVVVEPFTREFAAIEADAFATDILGGDLRAAHVVVGYDFSFGKGRRGDTTLLEALGARAGFGVSVVRRIAVHGLTCSSTKVREFVLEGRVEGAEVLLGRPFELTGVVTKGAGRGRDLGFPTANLVPDSELIPKPGIYAVRAQLLDAGAVPSPNERGAPAARSRGGGIPGGITTTSDAADGARSRSGDVERLAPRTAGTGEDAGDVWAAALSIGTNPTFVRDGALTVEAYLLDFDRDLYGRQLRLSFVQRLRDQRRYESVEALTAQIRDDVARTRELIP